MSQLPISFDIFIGDDVDQMLQVLKNNLPVDLTGVTEIELFLRKPDSAGVPQYFNAKKTDSKIVVSNAAQGTFRLVLAQADSALLLENCEASDFDVVVTDASNKEQTYRFIAAVRVLKRKGS